MFRLDEKKFANFKQVLRKLNLQSNQLESIKFEIFDGMQRLEKLDLSGNRINSVGKMLFGTTNGAASSLRELNLGGNRIEEIVDPGSFLYFTSLIVLNLGFNKITRLSAEAFNRLSTLESLNLEVCLQE